MKATFLICGLLFCGSLQANTYLTCEGTKGGDPTEGEEPVPYRLSIEESRNGKFKLVLGSVPVLDGMDCTRSRVDHRVVKCLRIPADIVITRLGTSNGFDYIDVDVMSPTLANLSDKTLAEGGLIRESARSARLSTTDCK